MLQEEMVNELSLSTFSDDQLVQHVIAVATDERRATARLVAALAEFDARKLYLGQGCASLFAYCTDVLHLSEAATCNRTAAARAAGRFPLMLARLQDGALTLTAARLLAPVLTPENCDALLTAAVHQSTREIEKIVATVRPVPDVPTVIRKLPARVVARYRHSHRFRPPPVLRRPALRLGLSSSRSLPNATRSSLRPRASCTISFAARRICFGLACRTATRRPSSSAGSIYSSPRSRNGGWVLSRDHAPRPARQPTTRATSPPRSGGRCRAAISNGARSSAPLAGATSAPSLSFITFGRTPMEDPRRSKTSNCAAGRITSTRRRWCSLRRRRTRTSPIYSSSTEPCDPPGGHVLPPTAVSGFQIANGLVSDCEVGLETAAARGVECPSKFRRPAASSHPTSSPNNRLDDAVSTRCVIRTSYGIYGFGSNSCAFITTENTAPTASAISSRRPFIIRITGRASAIHSSARSAWNGISHGMAVTTVRMWVKKRPSSMPL